MCKKIAYIELDTHAEIAQNFMELMSGNSAFEVDFYFSEKIKNRISGLGQNCIFVVDPRNLFLEISKKSYDLVIIGTAHRYFSTFLRVAQHFPVAIVVHNLNFSKLSVVQLFSRIFKDDFLYRVKLLFKEGLLLAPKMYREAHHRLVLDSFLASDSFQFLPVFFTKFFDEVSAKELKISIPGAVSHARRDYHSVLEKLAMEDQTMEVVFLGKAIGDELQELQKFSKEASSHIKITYFKERVSSTDFEQQMRTSKFLWCPIQRETTFFSQKEIYGQTKMSGNIGDAIKFGKISIFPKVFASQYSFVVEDEAKISASLKNAQSHQFDFQNFSKSGVQEQLNRVLYSLCTC